MGPTIFSSKLTSESTFRRRLTTTQSTSRRSTKPAPVREDWEDDDVEEIETEKDNQRIWDAAYVR